MDLRKISTDGVLARVQQALAVRLVPGSIVRKRRSVGFTTDRATWVRIEVRDISRIDGQSWGTEVAAGLAGVSMPAWIQGMSWLDHDEQLIWRADEMTYVPDPPVKAGGTLTVEPVLSESWWTTFNTSLDALAAATTTRVATLALEMITQERMTATIQGVFADVDTTVDEWAPAHADLGWANLTAPTCYLLDWEDWGMAPRGWDAATLWSSSLAVPTLANRLAGERAADFGSRAGKLARLFHCAQLIAAPTGYAGPLLEPAQAAAAELLTDLTITTLTS